MAVLANRRDFKAQNCHSGAVWAARAVRDNARLHATRALISGALVVAESGILRRTARCSRVSDPYDP